MKIELINIATIYLLAINVIGFVSMGIDKLKAIKRGWRIPERTLLLIAFLGGALGSFIGMIIFRHKIRNKKFQILVPIALILYIGAWHILHN